MTLISLICMKIFISLMRSNKWKCSLIQTFRLSFSPFQAPLILSLKSSLQKQKLFSYSHISLTADRFCYKRTNSNWRDPQVKVCAVQSERRPQRANMLLAKASELKSKSQTVLGAVALLAPPPPTDSSLSLKGVD